MVAIRFANIIPSKYPPPLLFGLLHFGWSTTHPWSLLLHFFLITPEPGGPQLPSSSSPPPFPYLFSFTPSLAVYFSTFSLYHPPFTLTLFFSPRLSPTSLLLLSLFFFQLFTPVSLLTFDPNFKTLKVVITDIPVCQLSDVTLLHSPRTTDSQGILRFNRYFNASYVPPIMQCRILRVLYIRTKRL